MDASASDADDTEAGKEGDSDTESDAGETAKDETDSDAAEDEFIEKINPVSASESDLRTDSVDKGEL